MHKKQADNAREAIDHARFPCKIVNYKCACRYQKIHGVNTRHAIFEVLLEPILCQLEIIVVPECYKETRQHKKDGYPDMELQEKTLYKMRAIFVEGVFVMRNKNEVGCQCTYPGKRGNVILLLSL